MTSPGEELRSAAENLCHIIKNTEYDDQLLVISKEYQRFDDLDTAIDWAMSRFSRDPSIFYDLGDNSYIWKMDKIMNFPKLRILFDYSPKDNTITLSSVEEIDQK